MVRLLLIFLAFVMMVILIGCNGHQVDRLQILADYGVNTENDLSAKKLKTAMAKMLPGAGSVRALEQKFEYIFKDQPDVHQSLAGEFERYHKIESDPALQMKEVKRLQRANEDNELVTFWLDQLSIFGSAEAHYMLHGYGNLPKDIEPRYLIFAAEHGILAAQVDLANWYEKRNAKGDLKKAYYWYLVLQSQGRNYVDEIARVTNRLSERDMREIEGKVK